MIATVEMRVRCRGEHLVNTNTDKRSKILERREGEEERVVVFVRRIAILDDWNEWLLVVMLVAAFLSETMIAIKPTGEE